MPKTDNPLTRAKTSPGVSYVIPRGKLVVSLSDPDQELFTYVIEIDPLEEVLLTEAARDVARQTFPGFKGDLNLPISERQGRLTLMAHSRFAPVMKSVAGKAVKTVRVGASVQLRVMLKAWPGPDGVSIAAFPSRIDVLGKTAKPVDPAQLDMDLAPVAEPVADPAPIARKPRATKPKPAPKKPIARTRAVVLPRGLSRAAYAAERAVIARTRTQARAAMEAQDPKPVRKSKKKPAPALPENVIPFPIHLTRKPS